MEGHDVVVVVDVVNIHVLAPQPRVVSCQLRRSWMIGDAAGERDRPHSGPGGAMAYTCSVIVSGQ